MAQHKELDRNEDPITGEPGAHPVGVGVGTAGGAAAGAVVGGLAGPVGMVAGAIVGGISGGLAGKGVAEAIDPTEEETYWREHYQERPYVKKGSTFEDYQPAYRDGWEARALHAGRRFDDAESELERDWANARCNSRFGWSEARDATRDAWNRVDDASKRRK